MRFDRKGFKASAKTQLKNRWTVPVLMTLICGFILSIFHAPETIKNICEIKSELYSQTFKASPSLLTLMMFGSIFSLIFILITDFAQTHVYLKMHSSEEEIKGRDFFEGTRTWTRSIAAGLWQTLWEFLWALLFIIPGVVKHYSYYFTKYIAIEYKDLSVTDALKISMKVTKGHKWHLFVTELSFIGWAVLCFFTCGIGCLWLKPYMSMTMVNAYKECMKEALENKVITEEEL